MILKKVKVVAPQRMFSFQFGQDQQHLYPQLYHIFIFEIYLSHLVQGDNQLKLLTARVPKKAHSHSYPYPHLTILEMNQEYHSSPSGPSQININARWKITEISIISG